MPNWVTNKLIIKPIQGSTILEKNVFDAPAMAGDRLGSLLKHFSFEKILPIPPHIDEAVPEQRNWKIDNWDTKWDAVDPTNDMQANRNKDGTLNLFSSEGYFLTAWSPPYAVIKKLQEMFPQVHIRLDYAEEALQFAGVMDSHADDEEFTTMYEVGEYARRLGIISGPQFSEIKKEYKRQEDPTIQLNDVLWNCVGLDYLDSAIELVKYRIGDLEYRTPEEDYVGAKEELAELNKTYDLLCDLSAGKKWILSKDEAKKL